MNKKGFTLIEVLASITIMGLIATLASINFITSYKEKEELKNTKINKIIETSACLYIELNKNHSLKKECLSHGCTITTDELIKEGILLKKDLKAKKTISIYQENNEKKCTINEE